MRLDFNAIKAAVSMEAAISFLGLKTTPEKEDPTQLRAACPFCKKDRVLSMSTTLQMFKCFSQKPPFRGDVIALVAHVKNIGQRDAAVLLQEECITKPKAKPKRKRKTTKPTPDHSYSIVDHLTHFE